MSDAHDSHSSRSFHHFLPLVLHSIAHLLSRTLTIPTDISGWLPLHLGYFYNCFTSVSRRSGTEKTRALSSMTLSDIFGVLDYLSWSLFTAAFDEERSDSLVRLAYGLLSDLAKYYSNGRLKQHSCPIGLHQTAIWKLYSR
uniref:Uncharacterized protein n=1 Tax=Psilocybe cubensis TaxID=181762 RepID=A0A8H7XLQ5_PSICU